MRWIGKSLREETVPKSLYDTAVLERDTLKGEVARLQEQMTDLIGKLGVLGVDEALERSLAQDALTLLQHVDTRRTGGAGLQKKIDEIVARARGAGLLEEEEKYGDETNIQSLS